MEDRQYFGYLYEIARHLNREYALPSALRKALEKTVDLLELETGWIWLVQDDQKSVYLAASYNLPPALSQRPERLSGWCYCIEKYLSHDLKEASNISEIRCSRLEDISRGTRNLKYHASIPISIDGQKIGLLNLLSKETQQLSDKQLSIVNTVSELIGIAVQRTRSQSTGREGSAWGPTGVKDVLERLFQGPMEEVQRSLAEASTLPATDISDKTRQLVEHATRQLEEMREQLDSVLGEYNDLNAATDATPTIRYPSSPLTDRELEVLLLVQKGHTNRQIAEQLFITERTVKFHMSSILSKLFASTRTEAVSIAVQRGLIGL